MFITGLAVVTAPLWLPAYLAISAVGVAAEVAVASAIIVVIVSATD